MQRSIQSFLGVVVVVFLLVSNSAAFQNDGLAGNPAAMGRRRMTNAERLARGLPPNPPAVRYTPGVVRARDGASATTTSTSPSASPTPPANCGLTLGYIAFSNGTTGGYVTAGAPLFPALSRTFDQSSAADVAVDTCSTIPISIRCYNCDLNPGWIAPGNPYNGDFGSETQGYLTYAPAGSGITYPGWQDTVQITVWSFDYTTSTLTPEWFNNDYTTPVPLSPVVYANDSVILVYSTVVTPFYFVPQ